MSSSKAKVILNPYAGRWLAQKQRYAMEQALQKAGISYELEETAGHDHGVQIAHQAVLQGFSPIIAAGGDGTISEIMNGMLQAQTDLVETPLGIIPLGSANDLVINLGLPVDLEQSVGVIAGGNIRKIDIGQMDYGNPNKIRYFDNNSAIGLEPSITLIQQRITRVRGILRYVIATVMGIMKNPRWRVQLAWEGGEYQGDCTLVTVGNCPLTGGLYMAPHASPYDGQLTFVHGYMSSRLQMLSLLPRTMKPGEGSYVEHPAIHEINSPWLNIHVETSTPLHADGEIQTVTAQDIRYKILPNKLPVLLQ
jgi:diacylglycerol kinase (ATP)